MSIAHGDQPFTLIHDSIALFSKSLERKQAGSAFIPYKVYLKYKCDKYNIRTKITT